MSKEATEDDLPDHVRSVIAESHADLESLKRGDMTFLRRPTYRDGSSGWFEQTILLPRGRGARMGEWHRPFDCMDVWCRKYWFFPGFTPPPRIGNIQLGPTVQVPITTHPPKQLTLRENRCRVYFVQESGVGAIKIGTARNVGARVSNMAVGTPHLLTVLVVISGNREVERSLHSRFRHARIRGEWFRPVPELLAYIASLKEGAREIA